MSEGRANVTFWPSLTNSSGRPADLEWGALFLAFSRWKPFLGDHEHHGWSPARFEPCTRGGDNVRGVSALVLDYDGTCAMETALALWKGTYGFAHTTRKHSPDAHRFRVILPFSREVTVAEYAEIWRRTFIKCGELLDPAPKDPSRFWFTPGCPDEQIYRFEWLTGPLLDPDRMLAEPDPTPNRPVQTYDRGESVLRRASAYLGKMPAAISGSAGHQALWAAALALVKGFSLSEIDAFLMLSNEYNPRCKPPWREIELKHKVRDASNRAKVPDGYKLDELRDWRPSYTSVARPDPEADVSSSAPEGAADIKLDPVRHFGVRTVAELLNGVYTRASTERPKPGSPSGCDWIDESIGGFRRGKVAVFGAPTSWGKSSFALMVLDASLAAGKRVLIVSGEDDEDMYGARIMARRSGVNAISIRDSRLNERDFSAMSAALDRAEAEPMFLNGIGKTAEFLSGAISAVCAKRDLDLVIVDYLQAFGTDKRCQDRRAEVTHVARCFFDAIKGAGTSGLVFSQLKRLRDDAPASMGDLKESGDIENMAEHVLIGSILKASKRSNEWHRMVSIEKNKDGPRRPRPFELEFDEVTASFTGKSVWSRYTEQEEA